jgi:siderophore ferric iron reductase
MAMSELPQAHRLLRLFEIAEAFVPGMKGEVGAHAPGHVTCGMDNRRSIAGLVGALADGHREAGRGFWAVRSWSMLTWQPAILAVLSVHRLELAPERLDRISQHVQGGAVYGYRLPDDAIVESGIPDLIGHAGGQLRAMADDLLSDLNAVMSMKSVLAQRLLADRVLGVLAHLRHLQPGSTNAEIRDFARQWLAAMSLWGQSGLTEIKLENGIEQLTLERKACCLEYRLGVNSYCPTCPRQDNETRVNRMREYWNAHVRAV